MHGTDGEQDQSQVQSRRELITCTITDAHGCTNGTNIYNHRNSGTYIDKYANQWFPGFGGNNALRW